jgi:hypothetical protein
MKLIFSQLLNNYGLSSANQERTDGAEFSVLELKG